MQQFFATVPVWASPWHVAQRESTAPRWHFMAAQAVIALTLGLLLGKIGAFGTYRELPALDRYVYWLAITVIDWGLIVAVARGLRGLPAFAALPVVVQVMLTVILAALPGTLAVCGLDSLLRVVPHWDWLPLLYVNTAVMSFAIALPVALVLHPPASTMPTGAAPAMAAAGAGAGAATGAAAAESRRAAPPPAFMGRLPPHLGRELLALEMEDHYLRVHTPQGSALILLRLRDALAELGGTDGLQVHRSWWVARAAMAAVTRENGKPVLRLTNGLSVPVSRSFRAAAKAAGWL